MKKDEQIKKDVVDRLATDSRVDASDITVKVDNKEVTLNGKVSTYSEKKTAKDIAWFVAGVTSVNDNLTVEFPSTFTTPTDSEIKRSVEDLLSWNADVDETEVNVNVENGFVTLEGSVPSFWEKMQAEDAASSANGVISVTNKLAVVPTEKITDELVGERVMERIEQNTPAFVDDVNVKVEDGRVTLSGSVPSYNTWKSVYETAQNTLGVTDVEDNIAINYA